MCLKKALEGSWWRNTGAM